MRAELERLKEEYEIRTRQIVRALQQLTEKIRFPLDPDPVGPALDSLSFAAYIGSPKRKLIIHEIDLLEEEIIEKKEEIAEEYRWRIEEGRLGIFVRSANISVARSGFMTFKEFIEYVTSAREWREENPNPSVDTIIYERLEPLSRPTFYRIIQKAGEKLPLFLSEALSLISDEKEKWDETLEKLEKILKALDCLLYTSPSPRDLSTSRMPSSA